VRRFGDWREGEPSSQLELIEAAVFMLLEDAPDLAGMVRNWSVWVARTSVLQKGVVVRVEFRAELRRLGRPGRHVTWPPRRDADQLVHFGVRLAGPGPGPHAFVNHPREPT
jgi:hypothetical protein